MHGPKTHPLPGALFTWRLSRRPIKRDHVTTTLGQTGPVPEWEA